jgi:D-alanyl-D-alanine carboxypeptidase (penicillin-binding protein 5/6)
LKRFAGLILVFALIITLYNAQFSDERIDNLKSKSYLVLEPERNQILISHNENEKIHTSLANKIMGSLISIENYNLDSQVTISNEAFKAKGFTVYLEIGEKYSVESLLYAVMLESANDASIALAEHMNGNINSFVDKMNEKANELGMKNTYFVNPTGLYDSRQYTTASDLGILVSYAIKNKTFDKIFSTKAKPWSKKNRESIILSNQNKLFWSYSGVDGGKIGINSPDFHSSLTTATKADMRIITILLDTPRSIMYEEIKTLLDYTFMNYRKDILTRNGDILGTETIFDTEVKLIAGKNVYYTYPVNEKYYEDFYITLIDDISLPVNTNEVIAVGTFILADGTHIDINLYSNIDIKLPEEKENRVQKLIENNMDLVRIIILLLVIEFILITINIVKKLKSKALTDK